MTRLNFLVPAPSEVELSRLACLEPDDRPEEFNHSTRNWTLQAYLALRKLRAEVTCHRFPLEGAINIGHCRYLRLLDVSESHFIVSVSGEYRHLLWAHLHIVQNQSQADGRRYHWLPLWPQPGLIPRKQGRTGVEVVGYAGRSTQLSDRNGRIRSKLVRFSYGTSKHRGARFWESRLESMGLRFRLLANHERHDLSEIDVLLGIRSFDAEPYPYLPPSKLINAWHAGVPFIGGNDSAFRQIGAPGRDHIRATNPDQALAAIERLRDDPEYYGRFVRAGLSRAPEYTRERVADRWIGLIEGPVQERYLQWLGEGPATRRRKLSIYRGMEAAVRTVGRVPKFRRLFP